MFTAPFPCSQDPHIEPAPRWSAPTVPSGPLVNQFRRASRLKLDVGPVAVSSPADRATCSAPPSEQVQNSPARVVDNLLDQATDVAVALGKVERTELGRRDTVVRVRAEDTAALTLVADDCQTKVRMSARRAAVQARRERREEQVQRSARVRRRQ